jgi:DNA end-binding protein Ku
MHDECHSRLKQLRWCPVHDRTVQADEVVRGYEYAKGQHVIVTDEDLEGLPVPSKHTIELSAFVEASEIDPVFYEKSYYLEADEVGVKPYALLMRALEEKKLTALAQLALGNKARLCALRPVDGTLMLETLYYPDEISVEQPKMPEVEISDRELGMAFTLIDLLSEDFQPEKYRDGYRDALLGLIEAKIQGQEIVAQAPPPPGEVIDLMAALRASVEAAQRSRDGDGQDEPARRAG